ncbi:MAG: hypothetical protein K0R73_573 [Candidatus Midichloriaceae bacterium]|jgi:hypothetical protein|nr:hypothetical protein [Candidatus Midichloriaceae bacterium]
MIHNKSKISAALISTLMISAASCALAQTNVETPNNGAQQILGDNSKTTPHVDVTPSLPSSDVQAPVSEPTISTSPAETVGSAPVAIISETPKADGAIIEKLVAHYNNKEVEPIISLFDKDGFIMVSGDGKIVRNADDLRKELVEYFASSKHYNSTAQVDTVKDLAPGLAMIGSYYNFFNEGDTSNPAMKAYGVSVVKYDDGAWKIVSNELTVMHNGETLAIHDHPASNNGNLAKMALVALIGAAIGFLTSRFLFSKTNTTNTPS